MSTRWVTARAWLDDDGYHIWMAHDCFRGREAFMLPYPTWKMNEDGKTASPSFHCTLCNCHTTGTIELGEPERSGNGKGVAP